MNQTDAMTAQNEITYFMHKEGLGVVSRFGGADSCAEFSIVRKTTEAPDEPSIHEGIVVKRFVPPDGKLLGRILAIFRAAYEEHSSEMFLHLGWNKRRQRYFIAPPKCQSVSGGYLRYNAAAGRFVGTIHSHGSMGAFFSSDDDKNEMGSAETAPGIYAVAGCVNSTPNVRVTVAGMGRRTELSQQMTEDPIEYPLSEREYRWWTRSLQPLSFIHAKTTGFLLMSPSGDLLRWAETGEELLPFAGKIDRIVPVGTRQTPHEVLLRPKNETADNKPAKKRKKHGLNEQTRLLLGGIRYGSDIRFDIAEKLDRAVRQASNNLDAAMMLMDDETYTMLCAAVDRTRMQTCEPLLSDVEESVFTWWNQ